MKRSFKYNIIQWHSATERGYYEKSTINTFKELLHTSIEMSSAAISKYIQLDNTNEVNYWNGVLQQAIDAERDLNAWLERRSIVKRFMRKLQKK